MALVVDVGLAVEAIGFAIDMAIHYH